MDPQQLVERAAALLELGRPAEAEEAHVALAWALFGGLASPLPDI